MAVSSTKHILLHSRDHRYVPFRNTQKLPDRLSTSVSDNLAYVGAWNAFALQANVRASKMFPPLDLTLIKRPSINQDTKDAMTAFVKKKPAVFSPLPNLHSKL